MRTILLLVLQLLPLALAQDLTSTLESYPLCAVSVYSLRIMVEIILTISSKHALLRHSWPRYVHQRTACAFALMRFSSPMSPTVSRQDAL